ncbi:MAG: tRNA (guanosine(37)-N1)-methyltransferase TrmD [Armatimonadetes bacterium]|nr:tRNA (guanosine(37)-N1)-methyltransferase TrmD [Armatimonadota bacterium]
MLLSFVTLFPAMIEESLQYGVIGRAISGGLCQVRTVDPRAFTTDNHKTVDDSPYGGGPGMLMKAEPLIKALASLGVQPFERLPSRAVVMTDPSGGLFTQPVAASLASFEEVVFVCGRYEGIDGRIEEAFATHVLSIGDFVLSGGELPALVMADAVLRLLPGVLGNSESLAIDSFSDGLLSAPQYTRPEEIMGLKVPSVLLSGDHAAVAKWKAQAARERTERFRPDLLD